MIRAGGAHLRGSARQRCRVRRAGSPGRARSTPSAPGCCASYAPPIGLDPAFTILDRGDAPTCSISCATSSAWRGPTGASRKKGTCLAIYSCAVNAQAPLDAAAARRVSLVRGVGGRAARLFAAYVEAKQRQARARLRRPAAVLGPHDARRRRSRPTSAAASITSWSTSTRTPTRCRPRSCCALKPDGAGVTVVGDDAQAIYAFRAATVRNILDFPGQFAPPAAIVTLEQNYRSTQPILDAANAVIGLAPRALRQEPVLAPRGSAQRPVLAMVARRAGAGRLRRRPRSSRNREAGVPLRDQAVLFRAAHHSAALEVELARRNIPFVKYRRPASSSRRRTSRTCWRPALGREPARPRGRLPRARSCCRASAPAPRAQVLAPGRGASRCRRWRSFDRRRPRRDSGRRSPTLLAAAARRGAPWAGADRAGARLGTNRTLDRALRRRRERGADLEQLEQLAAAAPRASVPLRPDAGSAGGDRRRGRPAAPRRGLPDPVDHPFRQGPGVGRRVRAQPADGCIPSDLATGTPGEIEEERRLLYVAMTRARDQLHLVQPAALLRHRQQHHGDRHVRAPRTRFIPDGLLRHFELVASGSAGAAPNRPVPPLPRLDIAGSMRKMWE